MDHFDEKGFWNIFNPPDPPVVVTLDSLPTTSTGSLSSISSSSSRHAMATEQYNGPYNNDFLPPTDLRILPYSTAQRLDQDTLSAEIEERGQLWLQFMLVTGLAFAAAVMIVLIVALTWAASGARSRKYTLPEDNDSSGSSVRNETNPMISEESV